MSALSYLRALLSRLLRGEEEWIVLHLREPQQTPSETVTAWDAYEAAPQMAKFGWEATMQFAEDSGLTGKFIAIPVRTWNAAREDTNLIT